MGQSMNDLTTFRDRRQSGGALLITVMILVLISMLSLGALVDTQQESTASARARSTTRTLHAADSGVQLALSRITQDPPNLNAFNISLAGGATLQSRARSETTPLDLPQADIGDVAEGYSVNVGGGAGYVNRVYLINVTGESGGSTVEVEAKISRTEVDAVGY
jgi:hypothetical protein